MFFEGSLQSGISLAIQQHKLVACFVRQDDDEISHKWENEWLTTPAEAHDEESNTKSLGDHLAEKAVFLRIDAGTQEAGFLGAFCSLTSIPKLLIIRQGSVLEDIDASVSREEFTRRISSQVQPQEEQQQQQQPTQQPVSADTNSAAADLSQVLSNIPFIGEQRTTIRESGSPAPPENSETNVPLNAPGRQANVQTLLEERAVRLEAERKKKEEAEKEARKAVARQRKEAADKDAAASSSVPHGKQDWADQQRNRQREARLERERILKTIESDKIARKQREEQRRILSQGESSTAAAQRPVQTDTSRSKATPICALQIRLFDGTSIRSRFDSSATLASSVRTYISQNSQIDIPYEFRQMLTPHPSKNISVGEENESLQSLGLTPSATLVLVPVKGYTDAYSGGGGLVSKGLNAGYGILSGAAGLVGSAVGSVIGFGGASNTNAQGPYVAGTADEQEASSVQGSRAAGINVRTLGDQRREANEGTELYNGNQLNFEPRKKKDGQGDAKDD